VRRFDAQPLAGANQLLLQLGDAGAGADAGLEFLPLRRAW
jgi:hypothetical protein